MAWDEESVREAQSEIRRRMRHSSRQEIRASLLRLRMPEDLVNTAFQRLDQSAEAIRVLRDPPIIEAEGRPTWYPGPGEEDFYWPAARNYLGDKWKNPEALKTLDVTSTRVVAALGSPESQETSVRGLVVGDVQSGKTSNFTAVIAKAVDAGYRLVIVLSGTKNKLRRQTQQRLDEDLVARAQNDWFVLTNADGDFAHAGVPAAGQVLVRSLEQPVLMAVKKNSQVLARVRDWLAPEATSMLKVIPTLVIDDEADEASINTRPAAEERSAVNKAILEILRLLPRASFVGYTATPYANFYIDPSTPEDLYPRDFIFTLPTGTEYFGYERIFGRERTRYEESEEAIDGLNMIRRVPHDEAELLRPRRGAASVKVELGDLPSLRDSICWFLLATSARILRGHADEHSSMLVHTSQRVAVHRSFREPVKNLLIKLLAGVVSQDPKLREELRLLWEKEIQAVPSSLFDRKPDPFDAVWRTLDTVLRRTRVIIENGMSEADERLVYGDQPGIFIVIGGDVLSRGLTLEGLVCSYFTRSASTYDTLMQMGRWFGYRKGYEDLPRIWMTDELRSAFFELGGIDKELRQHIDKTYVRDVTPATFAPMIRMHPGLAITSRMKMQGNIQQRRLSYSGRRVQTILFNHRNKSWLEGNFDATRKLLDQARSLGIHPSAGVVASQRLFRKVPVELILQFLATYRFHAESWNLNSELIKNYIEIEGRASSLLEWSVSIVTGTDDQNETVALGGEVIRTVTRSRIVGPDLTYANIKSLVSQDDCAVDLEELRDESFPQLLERRSTLMPNTGLLVIYPIDRLSVPRNQNSKEGLSVREPLDAVSTVIGVGLVFPSAVGKHQDGVYRQLQISAPDVEMPDEEILNAG